jgi:hypothetical protein
MSRLIRSISGSPFNHLVSHHLSVRRFNLPEDDKCGFGAGNGLRSFCQFVERESRRAILIGKPVNLAVCVVAPQRDA